MIELLHENCAFISQKAFLMKTSQSYVMFFFFSLWELEATWCGSQFDSRVTSVYLVYVFGMLTT